jgi:hypothetical protein
VTWGALIRRLQAAGFVEPRRATARVVIVSSCISITGGWSPYPNGKKQRTVKLLIIMNILVFAISVGARSRGSALYARICVGCRAYLRSPNTNAFGTRATWSSAVRGGQGSPKVTSRANLLLTVPAGRAVLAIFTVHVASRRRLIRLFFVPGGPGHAVPVPGRGDTRARSW